MRYVVGLLFSENRRHVALIRKDRPKWMAGLYNAPGGKIEGEEEPLTAVKREFLEETGVAISAWLPAVVLTGNGFEVHFFAAFSDKVFKVRTMESEEVMVVPVAAALDVHDSRLVPGLPTQIMIALDQSGIEKPVAIRSNLKGG